MFVRRVKDRPRARPRSRSCASGAWRVPGIEHIGSAHTDDELAVLLRIADERRHAGQLALDLDDAGEGGGRQGRRSRGHVLADPLGGPRGHLRRSRAGSPR